MTRLACVAAVVWGCGSGGATYDALLSGTMNVGDLVVPAGKTSTVSGDTVVHATGKIQIDGTLLIPPDTNVALIADGPVTISGSIMPGGAAPAARRAFRLPAFVPRAAVTRDTPPDPPSAPQTALVIAGKLVDVGLAGGLVGIGIETGPGATLYMCCTAPGGSITISSSITTGDGRDGAGLVPIASDDYWGGTPQPGQAGGVIDIGSGYAVGAAKAAGAATAAQPNTIVVTSTIKAGNGGRGQDAVILSADAKAKSLSTGAGVKPEDIAYANSRGGNGGSVHLIANNSVDASKAAVQIGSGGDAGSCGTAASPIGAPAAAPGQNGLKTVVFFATAGAAGAGTAVPGLPDASIPGGLGGNRGNAASIWIRGADGGPGVPASGTSSALPPGSGGSVQVENSTALFSVAPRGILKNPDPPLALIHVTGSGGGSSADPNSSGAVAGALLINQRSYFYCSGLIITDFGNGGTGFNGCTSTPIVSGGSGGDAGTVAGKPPHTALVLNRALLESQTKVVPTITNSFNGGDSGPGAVGGSTIGLGGIGGMDDSGNMIGKNGASSVPCSSGGYTVVALTAASKINDYGTIVGVSANIPYLQVPTTPRGTTYGTAISSLNSNLPLYAPLAINSNGTVLGQDVSGSAVWVPNTPNSTTGTVTDFSSIHFGGYGLNDSGAVVGINGIWRPGGSLTPISFGPTGGPASMNNSGQISGLFTAIVGGVNTTVGFRTAAYTSLNPATDQLNPLAGGRIVDNPAIYGHSINAGGDCVGDSAGTGITTWHAVLWASGSGTAKDLGTLGGDESDTAAINDARDVVGWSYIAAGQNSLNSAATHAFICPAGGAMRDLNSLIDPNSGWVLLSATDINNFGEIVGRGTNGTGASFFLLVPKSLSKAAANPAGLHRAATHATHITSSAKR